MKIALLILLCTMLHAAPVGNPAAPALIQKGLFTSSHSWGSLRLGYEGDFVSDGRLGQFNQGVGRVDCYEQDTNSGTATFNLLDRLDLYGVFGSSCTKANWRFEDTAAETITRLNLATQNSFLWGAGARIILYEWGHAFLGFGGRYSASDYPLEWFTSNGAEQALEGALLHWRQWQINCDFAYKIELLTPYIGVKYSNERVDLQHFFFSSSFENRIPVGLYLGCTLSNGQYFMLNLEGRLIDEEAVSISGDFRF